MLRKWTWLLPCWIWLWVYRTTGKSPYRVEVYRGMKEPSTIETFQAVRIDDDFVLVRHPLPARARTHWSVRLQRWRERLLREKKNRLSRKLSDVNAALRIEELRDDD